MLSTGHYSWASMEKNQVSTKRLSPESCQSRRRIGAPNQSWRNFAPSRSIFSSTAQRRLPTQCARYEVPSSSSTAGQMLLTGSTIPRRFLPCCKETESMHSC
ncbi:unnamed protein product [Mycena citricolor]|uniref:Uncharacterized protein n=1 Tax=Mycena citricolor TaxID=2018698 RepID=A0AAD2Q0F0_9AGAR|nr:unnamed protein product [Mycena citricolor]CAK5274609.1 unnamed protein product [Mycena citricolor]